MFGEFLCPRSESTVVILLNGHSIKLPSEFIPLYQYISVTLSHPQRCLHTVAKISQLVKVFRIRDCGALSYSDTSTPCRLQISWTVEENTGGRVGRASNKGEPE